MRRRVLLAALALPGLAQADDPPERTVRDLAYGEVLFEYFQDDHFTALTRLLAGLERNELPSHARDADLMLGALYLSYGQHQLAGEVFERVLATTVDPSVHDRAWYFLARIWHERGYLGEAEAALGRIGSALPESFAGDRVMLEAQVLMDQQRFGEALAVLEQWQRPDEEWLGFAKYNIGVALVRTGDFEGGVRVLGEVGQLEVAGDELAALRDKANVALGYTLLQAAQPVDAKPVLQRVSLSGPYSNKALLGVGWAAAELEDFQAALTPWVELRRRNLLDSAVQESLLAVPYAFSRLNADAQAADEYLAAIDAFTAESRRIDDAIDGVRNGELLAAWLAAQDDAGTGWYFDLAEIPETAESRYLVELMASNGFQEGVKNYRDLLELRENLARWRESLGAFDDILATRQRAYEMRRPAIEAGLADADLAALERKRSALSARLQAIEQDRDFVALATPDQQRVWHELTAMEPDLALIETQPGAASLADRQRFFKGLLRWDLERDYGLRLWREQRDLRDIERELARAQERQQAVSSALAEWNDDFATLSARTDALGPRVEALLESTDLALVNQRSHLERVAVAVLEAQRERLDTYLVQARFSLAAIYDRASADADVIGPVGDLR